jgi:hypothetical protein
LELKREKVKGNWKKLHNEELRNLHATADFIRVIKSRKMRWVWRVALMGEMRNPYKILIGKAERKRPGGGPRRRWGGNSRIDIREIEWEGLAQVRDKWRAPVNTEMSLRLP